MQNIEEQAVSITLFGPRLNNKPRGLYFTKTLFEGLIFGGANIRRGLSTEGNSRFKIDWAGLIVGSKFTVFAWYLRAITQVQAPGGAYIWTGDLMDGFLRYRWGAYIWRSLYMEGLIFGILRYSNS